MSRQELLDEFRTFIYTFISFFLLCSFVVSVSFLLFFKSIQLPEEQVRQAAPMVFVNIIILTTVFVFFDIIRRRITVDRPVKQIKQALKKITNGNFETKLKVTNSNTNFSEIMDSINKMTEELSGVETLRNDFISNVSHEMKTPLSVISNYGTLLQDHSLSLEQRKDYANIIVKSSKNLAALITSILKMNRLENQQIYPQVKRYNLSEQLIECLLQFESTWLEKNIEIETEIEDDIMIDTDNELLLIVWNNLLSNAFKFTSDGGKVNVSLKEMRGEMIVSVTDTGCGMTPVVGAHIFNKFYQGDDSHATIGNGLGLALVKRVIDITESDISVNSHVGVGTTFTVKLKNSNKENKQNG